MITVFIKEFIDNFRDRRVILNTLILGPLMGPVIFAVMIGFIASETVERVESDLELPVVGADNAPNLVDFLQRQGVIIEDPPEDPEQAVREEEEDDHRQSACKSLDQEATDLFGLPKDRLSNGDDHREVENDESTADYETRQKRTRGPVVSPVTVSNAVSLAVPNDGPRCNRKPEDDADETPDEVVPDDGLKDDRTPNLGYEVDNDPQAACE